MMKHKFVLGTVTFVFTGILVNFLLADQFLHKLRRDEYNHRIKLAKEWKTYLADGKSSESRLFPGKISKSFREYGCKDIPDFPESELNSELEKKLSEPWPSTYTNKFKQKFSPRTFNTNAFSFFCFSQKKSRKWKEVFLKQIIARLEEYSVEDKGALFFEYRFPFHPLDYDMPKKWRSAFAQGQILAGLILINEKYPSNKTKSLIERYFQSFIPKNRAYEVVSEDSRGYLWLDEYPLPGNRPTSFVLNGHIWGLLGVYYYWDVYKSVEAEKILRASIETVRDNIFFYRFEGRTNCYDMRTCELDYEPSRAFTQLGWLYEITNNKSFHNAQILFRRDYETNVRYRKALSDCKKSFLKKLICSWSMEELLGIH